MISLTVALPVFKSGDIVWLAMESLCRQKEINFGWELIVCEEKEGAVGVKYLDQYSERLGLVGCERIKYIPITQWIPLAQKWRMIAQSASDDSKVYVLQASDCFSHPYRLATAYRMLADTKHDWLQSKNGYFYDIVSQRVIKYNHSMVYPTALNMSCKMIHAKRLPKADVKKGVDRWFIGTINKPSVVWDESNNWKYGVDTHGRNKISKGRGQYFKMDQPTPPFTKTKVVISQIVPSDILEGLNQLHENIAMSDEQEIHFVYPWVMAPTRWKELHGAELGISIKSIFKNCTAPFKIFVIGDNPNIKSVNYILHERVKCNHDRRHFDVVSKMLSVIDNPDIAEDFIYMYDDVLLNAPMGNKTLRTIRAIDHVPNIETYFQNGNKPSNGWLNLFKDTIKILQKEGLPTYNYEIHAPRPINKKKMLAVIEKYKLTENALLMSTLYFNNYYASPTQLIRGSTIKADYHLPYNNPKKIDEMSTGRIFINFNDIGLTNELKSFLINKFLR